MSDSFSTSYHLFINRYLFNDHGKFDPLYCRNHNVSYSKIKSRFTKVYQTNKKAVNDKFNQFHPRTTFLMGAASAILIPKLFKYSVQFYAYQKVWRLLRRPHRLAGCATIKNNNNNNNIHQTDQILNKNGFAIGYSYKAKSPIWVSYFYCSKSISQQHQQQSQTQRTNNRKRFLNSSKPSSKLSTSSSLRQLKQRFDFRPDPDIPQQFRTASADFTNTSYDRGHLVSVANISNLTERAKFDASFLSCVALQHPALNRHGSWYRLERLMRIWARRLPSSSFAVVCGPLFDSSGKLSHKNLIRENSNSSKSKTAMAIISSTILSIWRRKKSVGNSNSSSSCSIQTLNGIAVPTHFYMAILHVQSGKSIAFLVENSESGGKSELFSKMLSVDRLEQLCRGGGVGGLSIFRSLPLWYRPLPWQRGNVDLDFWCLKDEKLMKQNEKKTGKNRRERSKAGKTEEDTIVEHLLNARSSINVKIAKKSRII